MIDWWKNYPWRLIQTNLREIDMLDIRAEQVVRDLQAFQATVLMINAAGIIASYPTRLPFHFQSPYLAGDSLLKIVDACHAAGIRVIARTDFSKVRMPIYQQHPEWAYRNARGEMVDYNGDIHVCVNSWYQQDGILQILDELFSSHPFDGVFFNMGGYIIYDYSGNYHGPCCCQNCQGKFHEMFQQEFPFGKGNLIPPPGEVSGNVLYAGFKAQTIKEQEAIIHTFLAASYPHLCIANHLDFDHGFIRQESNTALDRPLPLWQYSASENTKWAVGSHPEMVSSNTSVDFIDFPYRHVAVSPHEQALRLAQNLANGGALDYYLIGRLDNHADHTGFEAVREVFHFHAGNEKEYQGLVSQADIVLIKQYSHSHDEYRGWYRVLCEGHFLFDVMTLDAVQAVSLKKYKAVILPGIEVLEASFYQNLDQFTEEGGTLIVSGFPPKIKSKNPESPDDTSDELLLCLGIRQIHTTLRNLRSPYFHVEDPLTFQNLGATSLVYLEGDYIQAEYEPQANLHLKFIPPHNFGPPERCYYEEITDFPGVVRHPFGNGRVVYLPWYPASQFYRRGQLNTYRLLLDVLENITRLPRIKGNIPEQVEVTLSKNTNGAVLLHLVNLSGHFGNSYHPPIRITDLQITIPWQDQAPAEGFSLLDETSVRLTQSDEGLSVWLEKLDLFDVIRIDKVKRTVTLEGK